MKYVIPTNVSRVTSLLIQAGYEAYLVGGCVRDLVLKKDPKDWDVTTNATPEKIIEIFEKEGERVVYENTFGTVAIIFEKEEITSQVRTIEVTPYRTESSYSDRRHPDIVNFAKTLSEDLERRDFTMNALALHPVTNEIVDIFGGLSDISNKIIRATGDPSVRFQEDALRMIRAIRFSAQLDFNIEEKTKEALTINANLIEHVSHERIRDEFEKIIMSEKPMLGLELLREHNLLQFISPELEEGIGVSKSRSHIYDVWEHCARACDNAAKQAWPIHVRIAALFHDVGKPRTRRHDKQHNIYTFYGHEVVGARMVEKFLERLHFPKKLSEIIVKLVRYHMFFSDTEKVSLSAVRRMIRNVGREHIWDLMNVRRSDRIGMGRPMAAPYRLRMYESMIDEATRDPIDVSMLAIDGEVMIKELGMQPSKEIGWILHVLIEEVLENPKNNTKEHLIERTKDLLELDIETLQTLGEKGKKMQQKADTEAVKQLRTKHTVKFEGKKSKR